MNTKNEPYSEANQYYDLIRFYDDVIHKELKVPSPQGKIALRGTLLHKSPIEIVRECPSFKAPTDDPSRNVRGTLKREIYTLINDLDEDANISKGLDVIAYMDEKYRHRRHNIVDNFIIDKRLVDHQALSFGKIQTTWLVKDGSGESIYRRENINSYFTNEELVLPLDLQERRNDILNSNFGKTFWNGERYFLSALNIYRSVVQEEPCLDLTFGSSDYATFLATNQQLDKDRLLRKKYIDETWDSPQKYFSNGFSVYLSVITSDGYLVITQRGSNVLSRPGEFNVSVNEALSKDKDHFAGKPDIFNIGVRGIKEELGVDIKRQSLAYVSFGVDTILGHWGLLGLVEVDKNKKEIELARRNGVEDKWENSGIDFVDFNPRTVIDYVFSIKEKWAPGGLACVYHTLVNKFGRQVCDKILSEEKYQ